MAGHGGSSVASRRRAARPLRSRARLHAVVEGLAEGETGSRILALIARHGGRRPADLVADLGITPQAIHRHLKRLAEAGTLERRGRGPRTRYFLAGAPGLDAACAWYRSKRAPPAGPLELICPTRDVFEARQSRLIALSKAGLAADQLPLLVSVAGEVGNNCFDHNLGHWRDVPGCWFETQVTGGRLWLCIADRGRGVLDSLSTTQPQLKSERAALSAAFERNVSGRSPEKRGNGLKFVRNVILQGKGRGLACRSGGAQVGYGPLAGDCGEQLSGWTPNAGGTATLIVWSLK